MTRRHHCYCVRNLVAVLIVGAAALLGPGPAADGSFDYRKIALSGEPAPGTAPDIVFGALTTALNHSIMVPRIDDGGRVAFIGFITGPGVAAGNQSGIWKESDAGLVKVVRTGEMAPGTDEGVLFLGVPSEYIAFPPEFANGRVSFQGELVGPGIEFSNKFGVWRETDGGLMLVSRTGDPAPDLPAGFVTTEASGIIDNDGHSLLMGAMNGPGVTTENNEARWSDRSGSMTVLVREGDPAPGINAGVVIGRGVFGTPSTFPALALNRDGFMALSANLLGPGVDAFSDEALYIEDVATGGLSLLARESDPAPGLAAGVTFGGGSVLANFRHLSFNGQGDIAFRARLGGAIETTESMFSTRTGQLRPVLAPGAPLPGSDLDFSLFGSPVLNEAGRLAFTHAVTGGSFPPFGIWWDQDDLGNFVPAVLPGDAVGHAGSADLVLNGVGGILGYNGAGMLAFSGSATDSVIGFRSGAFVVDADGVLRAVALTGGLFDVFGDGSDLREVLRVESGGFSESGAVAFRLDFTDGTSGHFAAGTDCNGTGLFDDRDMAAGNSADANSDGVPDECQTLTFCPVDITGDNGVGVDDLVAVILAWGTTDVAADVNADGIVDVDDLIAVIAGWGSCL